MPPAISDRAPGPVCRERVQGSVIRMMYLLDRVEFTPEDIDTNTATALWVDRIRPTFEYSAEVRAGRGRGFRVGLMGRY